MTEREFLALAFDAARSSGHIFPDIAACEAAYVSKWGTSEAAVKGNNLFDFRVPAKRGVGTLTVKVGDASRASHRLAFRSWEACFRHRRGWMEAVTMFYLARRAKTGAEYLAEMNKLASDPTVYGPAVKAIREANEEVFHEHARIGG